MADRLGTIDTQLVVPLRTLIPQPLSVICISASPPLLTVTAIDVLRASRQFSIISFSALEGRWITSPAAWRERREATCFCACSA